MCCTGVATGAFSEITVHRRDPVNTDVMRQKNVYRNRTGSSERVSRSELRTSPFPACCLSHRHVRSLRHPMVVSVSLEPQLPAAIQSVHVDVALRLRCVRHCYALNLHKRKRSTFVPLPYKDFAVTPFTKMTHNNHMQPSCGRHVFEVATSIAATG